MFFFLTLYFLTSAACLWHIWRRIDLAVGHKVLFFLMALFPLIGPVFYMLVVQTPTRLSPEEVEIKGGPLRYLRTDFGRPWFTRADGTQEEMDRIDQPRE